MKNGGNLKNIDERENKTKATTRKILTWCSTDVIRQVEIWALLKLHETSTISMMLTNCETWLLNKGERTRFDKIELWALKKILNVPLTTPSPAVWFATGSLLTSLKIDQRQLLYLRTLLQRPEDDWTKKILLLQNEMNIGWAKNIRLKLEEYGLETSWDKIKHTAEPLWKGQVKLAVEKMNTEKIIEMCSSKKGEKTKTKTLIDMLKAKDYSRKPMKHVVGIEEG